MNCDQNLHDGLKKEGEILCPLCNNPIAEYQSTETEPCCSNQDIIDDTGMRVCYNCGQVVGYNEVHGYIDFYEEMYKIRRKSVYQRNYHIENVINDICTENRIVMSGAEIKKICKVFDEIGKILPQVNNTRKRMISVKFILRQVFQMLGLPYEQIHISKSKRTRKEYRRFWSRVLALKGEQIRGIINK